MVRINPIVSKLISKKFDETLIFNRSDEVLYHRAPKEFIQWTMLWAKPVGDELCSNNSMPLASYRWRPEKNWFFPILCVCAAILNAVLLETCGISFVMPVSAFDLNLTTSDKGILGAVSSNQWIFVHLGEQSDEPMAYVSRQMSDLFHWISLCFEVNWFSFKCRSIFSSLRCIWVWVDNSRIIGDID